jgi:hypothetical protein
MEKIATLFLGMQVDLLTQFIEEQINLDKDRLFHCLKTISSFIVGKVIFPRMMRYGLPHTKCHVFYKQHSTSPAHGLSARGKERNADNHRMRGPFNLIACLILW